MINFLEVVEEYNDFSWQATFYYISVLALLIGIFWTYMQVFVKKGNNIKKEKLKENIIYNQNEDVIENDFKHKNNYKKRFYRNKGDLNRNK